jgi:RNA polymerase sigma factor (sigma-70 family)
MTEDKCNWEEIYEGMLPKVFNYFRYRVSDGKVAEDLTATTFEKAWKARKRYRKDRSAFTTWILTIARNVGTDYLRTRRDMVPLDEAEFRSDEPSMEELSEKQEQVSTLLKILSGLNERERELISFKYGAEMTNRDISKITGLSETNVGTILHRTVAKLKEEWDAENDQSG